MRSAKAELESTVSRLLDSFAGAAESRLAAFPAGRSGHFETYLAFAAPVVVLCAIAVVSLADVSSRRPGHSSMAPTAERDQTNALSAATMANYSYAASAPSY